MASEPWPLCLVVSLKLSNHRQAPEFFTRYELDLAAARQALAIQPDQVGALIYLVNRSVGLDLLADPGLFSRAWRRLCAGYVADAISREAKRWRRRDPASVVRACPGPGAEPAPAVGLGEEYRLGTTNLGRRRPRG